MLFQVSLMGSVLAGSLAADDGESSDGFQKMFGSRIIVTRDLDSPS